MRTLFLRKAFFFAVVACFAATTAVAEPVTEFGSPAYKLQIATPGAFQLNSSSRELYAPAPAGHTEPHGPSRLADRPFTELIGNAARDAALDPALVHALIYVESRYNPAARSPKGAVGLMQVLPETAARYGVANPARSPEANLRAGTRYLSDLLRIFDGHLYLALAAYNAGENAVQRYGMRIPPYPETQAYVPAVIGKYREWQEPPAPAPGTVRIQYLQGTLLDPESVRAAAER